jgi:hypothetical protein
MNTQTVSSGAPSPEVNAQLLYEHQVMVPEAVPGKDLREKETHVSSRVMGGSGVTPVIPAQPFAEVYQQAGIRPPAHGFTILKIAEMVSSSHLRDLSREGKRGAILMALEASNVQVQDVIEDGAQRDTALNDYEAQQQKMFQDFKARKQHLNQETQAEMERLIEACRATIQANEKEIADEKARLDDWRTKKREEERRMRSAASHLVANASGNTEAAGSEADGGAPSSQRQLAEMPPPPASVSIKAAEGRTPGGNGVDRRTSLWKR